MSPSLTPSGSSAGWYRIRETSSPVLKTVTGAISPSRSSRESPVGLTASRRPSDVAITTSPSESATEAMRPLSAIAPGVTTERDSIDRVSSMNSASSTRSPSLIVRRSRTRTSSFDSFTRAPFSGTASVSSSPDRDSIVIDWSSAFTEYTIPRAFVSLAGCSTSRLATLRTVPPTLTSLNSPWRSRSPTSTSTNELRSRLLGENSVLERISTFIGSPPSGSTVIE